MSVFYWTLRALLSHWRRHPVQFFSVLTGLWLATALLTGVQALNSQARDSYARASQLIGGEPQASLSTPDGASFAQTLFAQLRRAGWPVSPVVQGRVQLQGHEDQRLQLMGIEPLSLPGSGAVAGQRMSQAQILAFFAPPGLTFIAPQTLRALGLHEGEQPLTVTGQRLPPLQAQADMAPGLLLTDIGFAQTLLAMPERLSRLLVDKAFAASHPTPPAELQLKQGEDNNLARLTESFHLNLDALGFLSFVVGLFIVHAAIGLALEQRRGLLRTLRACGVSARCLILGLGVELGVLSLLGGVLGVASGYLLASLLLPDVAASLRGLYGAEVPGQLSLSPGWWLAGLGLSLFGALLAGANSLWRAARLPLLALANAQAWHEAHGRWLRRQGYVAAAALLVALLALWRGDSLAAGFVLMAALLLGAALGLPVLLNGLLKAVLGRSRSVLGQWFLADCRQQLPALSLALMALLLALAANIGAGSMTSGFRLTFNHWLEQRLTAELYLNPQTPAQAEQLGTWLAQQPLVRAVLPTWQVAVQLEGWPADLAGVVDDATYRQHWPLLEAASAPWDQLRDSDSVMLSEQLARRLALSVGDTLDLPTPQGRWALKVVGIYADYGNPKGHLLINATHLLNHWPGLSPSRFNLRVAPSDVPPLIRDVQRVFALEDSRIIDQQQLKGWSSQVFERTFAATAALNSLTLGVAGVALFISLLTQSQSRLGQLAPLWALGVTRRQLMLLNLGQTWLLAVLTLCLALPLGLLLAWCLDAVINVQAFGWRLPLQVFPWQLAQLLGLAMLATLLASAWPLWQLYRSRPTDLLRTFAYEVKSLCWAVLLVLAACDKAPAPEESFAGLGSDAADFAQVVPGKVFSFPEDHGPHAGFRIEWWYVTANLKDAQGNVFGVQWTLFRNALKAGPTQPGWHDSTLWLGHAAVTSDTRHYAAERFARGGVGQAGAQAAPFNAWIDDWHFTSRPGATSTLADMQLKANGAQFAYDLRLTSSRPLVLQGDNGYSRKSDQGQASYYYSQPFLRAEGSVSIDGKTYQVSGPAWLDREWSSQPLSASQKGWDWFSLHLDRGAHLMLFRVRQTDGAPYLTGTWIDREGRTQTLHNADIQLTPLGTTAIDGRQIPTRWSLKIPSKQLDITTEALNPNAWMNLSIPYWEGPVRFDGGVGYLEMTGY